MKYSKHIKQIEYELENDCSIFYIKDKGYVLQFKHNGLHYIMDSDYNVYLSVGFWMHVQKDERFTKYFNDKLNKLIKFLINFSYNENNKNIVVNNNFYKYSPQTHLKINEHNYIDLNNIYLLQQLIYKILY